MWHFFAFAMLYLETVRFGDMFHDVALATFKRANRFPQ